MIDVATLTGAMVIALGNVYSGVFTNSDALWSQLDAAGQATFDRFWRMPLDEEGYGPQIYSSNADLCNVSIKTPPHSTISPLKNFFMVRLVEGKRDLAPPRCS